MKKLTYEEAIRLLRERGNRPDSDPPMYNFNDPTDEELEAISEAMWNHVRDLLNQGRYIETIAQVEAMATWSRRRHGWKFAAFRALRYMERAESIIEEKAKELGFDSQIRTFMPIGQRWWTWEPPQRPRYRQSLCLRVPDDPHEVRDPEELLHLVYLQDIRDTRKTETEDVWPRRFDPVLRFWSDWTWKKVREKAREKRQKYQHIVDAPSSMTDFLDFRIHLYRIALRNFEWYGYLEDWRQRDTEDDPDNYADIMRLFHDIDYRMTFIDDNHNKGLKWNEVFDLLEGKRTTLKQGLGVEVSPPYADPESLRKSHRQYFERHNK